MARSVAEKLLIKPDTTVWLSDAGRGGLVEPLPKGLDAWRGWGRQPSR